MVFILNDAPARLAVTTDQIILQSTSGFEMHRGSQPKHVRLWFGTEGPNQNTSRIQLLVYNVFKPFGSWGSAHNAAMRFSWGETPLLPAPIKHERHVVAIGCTQQR